MSFGLGFWAAAGAGGGAGGAAYEQIATTILGSNSPDITFSSISSGYKHLQIRYTARTDLGTGILRIRFNGSSSAVYTRHRMLGNAVNVSSSAGTGLTETWSPPITANTNTAGNFASGIIDILDYASTSKNKTVRSFGGATQIDFISLNSGLFADTTAISSINLFDSNGAIVTGSRFSLYGIKG